MKEKIFLIVLCFNVLLVHSQINKLDVYFNEQVVAPNVDATAMFKFSDAPVNLASGLVNVNIPLYDIEIKGVKIPILLNYHGRGIQVSEIASSSGLGWSLNYGGMVSRQVRGQADDSLFGYLNQSHYKNILNSSTFDVSSLASHFNTHDNLDLIPDRFFFNIGGESGEFIFDQKTGAILQQSFTDIKIVPRFKNSLIVGWKITDTKGNIYHFGVLNDSDIPIVSSKHQNSFIGYNPQTTFKSLGESLGSYNDSWYLLKVQNYFGQEILFSYEWENVNYHIKQFDKRKNSNSSVGPYSYETYYAKVFENSYSIKSITHPLGKLVFTRDIEGRKDLNGGHALKSIQSYALNNELLSGYDFTYSYAVTNTTSDTYERLPQLDPSSKHRIFLKEVQKLDKQGKKDGLYKLEYNSKLLPNRFSTAKDMWGYYNGNSNGTAWVLGENKNLGVNGSMAVAGILTSVEYPTGRKEIFHYEDNILQMKNELYKNLDAYELVDKKMNFNVNPLASEGYTMDDFFLPERDNVFEFTLPSTAKDGFKISFVQNLFEHSDYGPISGSCHWLATIYRDGVPIKPYHNGVDTYLLKGEKVNAPGLSSGIAYTLKINGPMGGCGRYGQVYGSCRVEINWVEEKSVYDLIEGKFITGPGRRIKRIEVFDENHLQKTRSFSYTDENGKSSGHLFGMPPYNFLLGTSGHFNFYTPFGMEDSSPVSGFRHNSLVYGEVTEYLGTPTDNQGKINYTFTSFDDGGGGYYEWPFYLAINKEWKRGLPLTTKHFKKNNSVYTLEKEEINTYKFFDASIPSYDMFVRGGLAPAPGTVLPPFPMADMYENDRDTYKIPLVRFYRDFYGSYNNTADQIDPRFQVIGGIEQVYYKRYYLTGGRYYKEKSEIIDYSGSSQLKRTIVNQHSSLKHYLPTSIKETDQLGVIQTTNIQYAPDIISTINQKLVTANRIKDPVKIENFRNTVKTYSSEKVLKDWGNNLVDLESIKEYKGSQLSENNDKILHKDNSNGNTLEIESSGIKTVYLYGYNKTLLIAEIVNASKEEVASALGVTVANLNTINETKFAKLNALRAQTTLENAMITTYEHKPLVGVSKIIDPKNISTYYEYDDANRLQYIKDDKNNILKEYEYNYKQN